MNEEQNGAQFFKQQISILTRIESDYKKRASQQTKDMSNYNYVDRQSARYQQYQPSEHNRQAYRQTHYYKNNAQYHHNYYQNNNYRNHNNQKYNFSKGNGRERRYDHQNNNEYQNYNNGYTSHPNAKRAYQKRDNNKKIIYKQKIVFNQKEDEQINIKKIQDKEVFNLNNQSDIIYEEVDIPNEQNQQKEEELTDYKFESMTSPEQIEVSQQEQQCLQMKINLNPIKKLLKSKIEKQFIKEEQVYRNSQFSISKSWQVDCQPSITQNIDLNLSRQAYQFLQFFDNWQKFQDYPLKSVWIHFNTNSFINEVKILSVFIIPLKQELKLQNNLSSFFQVIKNKFQFRKKQYWDNETKAEMCKMRIPGKRNHDLNEKILRKMVEVKNVRVKCSNCQSINVISFKNNKNSAASCQKCSGRMEISINSLTLYQPK